jgi:predicted Ser/Thr protein kinase
VRCTCGAGFDPSNRPTVADPLVGRTLDGFRIDGLIGRGGMGTVYRAQQISLGRPVALKVLPADLCDEPQFRRSFHREAEVLGSLSHPNLVQVYDRGTFDGRPYLVMELVEGDSLRDLMRRGPVPARQACRIIAALCDALDYAHAKGVVHRDIKPENVLVSREGIVKVADFGLSKVFDGSDAATRLTVTHLQLGTYEYMAPEQRERAADADERADIYATAVVLYEMLTGELPIGRFELPGEKRPDLDARIDDVLERGLAKNPSHRYDRASVMGRDVSALLSTPDRRIDLDHWLRTAKRFAHEAACSAREAVQRFAARRNRHPASADDRLRAYRRRRREAVNLNDRIKRAVGFTALGAWITWYFVGYPHFRFHDEVAFFWTCGVFTAAAWFALHLLNRQVERGRWLVANAVLWTAFTPFHREGARRAKLLRRDARILRRMGLSTL